MAKQGTPSRNAPPSREMDRSLILGVFVLAALLVGGAFLPNLLGTASAYPTVTGGQSGPAAPSPSTFQGYNVTFSQTGLPRGTAWSVTFNGVLYNNNRRTVTIPDIPNGTYAWNTTTYAGLYPTPASGSLTVTGAPLFPTITFAPPQSVTFTETGLPGGTIWGVTFNLTYYVSSGFGANSITINSVANNTYLNSP